MKTFRFLISGLLLLLLTSCDAISSQYKDAHPLILKLEIAQREVNSFEDLYLQVSLKNQSDSSVLVFKSPIPMSL